MTFDIITLRLTLQYIRNVSRIFQVVRAQLRPNGAFVFSIEHPIISATYDGETTSGIATKWRVRRYFHEGQRVDRWLNSAVIKQHRTLETYISELRHCGFHLDRFSEGRPTAEKFQNSAAYLLRMEVPICIIFRCIPDLACIGEAIRRADYATCAVSSS